MSRFYVNCKPTTMDPEGMYLIGNLVIASVADLEIEGIGGLTFGADPIAMAAAFASHLAGRPVKAFSIRKAKKDHGVSGWLEGDIKGGGRVVVVDDVVTTGGSTIAAAERAAEEGLTVVRALVLVDRQEDDGMASVRKTVPDARAIVTASELMEEWERRKKA